jgi:hypothetical protein
MKLYVALMVVVALASGCASSPTSTPTAAVAPVPATGPIPANPETTPAVYRGEVWTWDEKAGWVTLRIGSQDVRVIPTDKGILKSLNHHTIASIRGTLAPHTIETYMTPAPAGVYVPVGTAVELSSRGRVVALDPKGIVKFEAGPGTSELWISETSTYKVGDTVIVETSIRPVQFRTDLTASPAPAAGIATDPGDHAVVTGRVLSRNSDGRLTVDSPRGPIQVWLAPADVEKFKVGDFVQVRSRIRTAS